ncbi:Alkyl hydroperoxide reductase subunit [Streptococcus parauberis]|uniref:Alkyl hydroperoxide reductase protein F n=1 Tax=Streptococcus parauberis KRS-02083 TaxID=1207545 RepID=A0ABN0IP81_9STRE|nr:alkyl hydroperoxide reductase subunit F [Streptococcus parauberis]AUT04868.1 Alkyl hydroperoxide reductase subunit [Streptococcus parauberis]EMG24615.1 Alkyl hydroperoxide reductase protein F [Streptococcus parauberis KRS-02083]UWV10334.1 alkyl hydroperoxide reductase subunit F [Streptococcus parauberis]WEM65038.1 alkyl hydroperoxide reductase subunit F [Streptococcus parauberis]WOF46889.1 alkyl hydroperoxide reductase subunit F [Streptococcus parauberis]
MSLTPDIKNQIKQYLDLLESDIVFQVNLGDDQNSKNVKEFLEEIANMSSKITIEEKSLTRQPSFKIAQLDKESGVEFAGIPLGHEFTSFVLALLQVSGRPPKIEQELANQIKAIDKELHFETYVSLSCHNCPDVVQAFNIMSVLNPKISHTMIEGGMFQDEVKERGIMAVPTVYLDNQVFSSGRTTVEQLLEKITGPASADNFSEKGVYDVLVIGGGPAGNSSAIYAARKGLKTGLLAETFGGQVMETVGIENMIGTLYTEGPKLMAQIEEHTKSYNVDIIKVQLATSIAKKEDLIEVTLANGAVLQAKTAILALGAKWRNINVPCEDEFRNKGVTYCPHCDGPLFEGKDVAVIGGGNSGMEAALDLAGLCKQVTVLEFLPEVKADQVLQDRAAKTNNLTIITNAATKDIVGQDHVTGLNYTDRESQEEKHIDLEGVFVQIGLVPNTQWLKDSGIELTDRGEIVVDGHGSTNIPGIFAAGDCTNSIYKQIIISMGSGATAAIGAFDYLIRQ